MQPTALGLLLLPICLCFAGNPVRLLQIAFVAAIFEAGAALTIGGSLGIPVAMVPGLMFLIFIVAQYLLGMRYPGERLVLWTALPLILLLGYALAGALLLPDAFQGQVLVRPQKPDPLNIGAPVPLQPDGSGRNQCLYLAMNVVVMVGGALFLSRRAIPYRKILAAYLLGGYAVVLLAAWQFVARTTGLFFPDDLLYSNPGLTLMIDSFGGIPRLNGPFSEASALANYLSGVVFCCLWLSIRGHRVMAPRLLLVLGVLTILASTSTTGIVTVVVGIPLILLFATGSVGRRNLGKVWVTVGLLAAALILLVGPVLVLAPKVVDAIGVVVEGTLAKTSSDSYADRSTQDSDAIVALLDTYGLGVGWGSFRSSSLLPGILANGGLIGLGLVLWFGFRVRRLARQPRSLPPAEAAADRRHEGWAAVDGFAPAVCGQVAAGLLAAPMLTSLSFFLQLACLLGAAARIRLDRGAAAPAPAPPPVRLRGLSGPAIPLSARSA